MLIIKQGKSLGEFFREILYDYQAFISHWLVSLLALIFFRWWIFLDFLYTQIIITFFYFFSLQYIRISGKNIKFDNKKIKRSSFYKNKKINNIEDIDVNNILVSKKESYGNKNSFKYFIGYNDNDVIRPLCIKLPQMTGYARKLDENTTMPFIVKDKKLLKKIY